LKLDAFVAAFTAMIARGQRGAVFFSAVLAARAGRQQIGQV
jgi:hypothetical protein